MMRDNYERAGRIVRVVDGDTLRIDVDCGYYMHAHITVRLLRTYAAEMSTVEGRQVAVALEQWLSEMGYECTLRSSRRDRYGRWLADVEVAGQLLADVVQVLADPEARATMRD